MKVPREKKFDRENPCRHLLYFVKFLGKQREYMFTRQYWSIQAQWQFLTIEKYFTTLISKHTENKSPKVIQESLRTLTCLKSTLKTSEKMCEICLIETPY